MFGFKYGLNRVKKLIDRLFNIFITSEGDTFKTSDNENFIVK